MAPANKPSEKPKKTDQINFRLESDTHNDLLKAASDEKREKNAFARLLFEYGFEQYKKAGTYDALIGRRVPVSDHANDASPKAQRRA